MLIEKKIGLSEEHGSGGNHREHPQPLPPLNPHESHDNHVKDVFRARTELESEFAGAKGACSVKLCDDSFSAVKPLKLVGNT